MRYVVHAQVCSGDFGRDGFQIFSRAATSCSVPHQIEGPSDSLLVEAEVKVLRRCVVELGKPVVDAV